jgi:hypothetical protein
MKKEARVKPNQVRLSKYDYMFIIGLIPFVAGIVSSIYRASQVNWYQVANEEGTALMKSDFMYYFVNTVKSYSIFFIISLGLIIYSLIKINLQLKESRESIRKLAKEK